MGGSVQDYFTSRNFEPTTHESAQQNDGGDRCSQRPPYVRCAARVLEKKGDDDLDFVDREGLRAQLPTKRPFVGQRPRLLLRCFEPPQNTTPLSETTEEIAIIQRSRFRGARRAYWRR